jgi:hypothetical protein
MTRLLARGPNLQGAIVPLAFERMLREFVADATVSERASSHSLRD